MRISPRWKDVDPAEGIPPCCARVLSFAADALSRSQVRVHGHEKVPDGGGARRLPRCANATEPAPHGDNVRRSGTGRGCSPSSVLLRAVRRAVTALYRAAMRSPLRRIADSRPVVRVRQHMIVMPEGDVLRILAALNDADVRFWVAGGWGIDAIPTLTWSSTRAAVTRSERGGYSPTSGSASRMSTQSGILDYRGSFSSMIEVDGSSNCSRSI